MGIKETSRRTFISAALAALVTLSACGGQSASENAATGPVGLVVTSIDNPYFVEMTQAAQGAARADPALQLVVQAPERGAVDPERQQQLVEALIAQRASVLLIVPADSRQIVTSIEAANRANIPVVILDNDVDRDLANRRGARIAAFIGSDNVAGGRLAGDFVRQRLPTGGEVAILEGVSGVQAATDRKAGFVASISQQPSLRVVASQAADWDRERGYNATRAILVAHPNLRAVFAANDEMALGAARALAGAGRSDVILVGYDATPDGRAGVANGTIHATIAQQPREVGRQGVELARRLIRGETVPARTVVPLEVVTRTRPAR